MPQALATEIPIALESDAALGVHAPGGCEFALFTIDQEGLMERRFTPRRRSAVAGLTVMAWLTANVPQAMALTADDCTDICGSGSGACTIGANWDIVPGSVIDCSGRDVTVTINGVLKVTDGGYSLYAANLQVDGPGGTLTAVQGSNGIPGSIFVKTTGWVSLSGKIRANGDQGGGTISVVTGGDMVINDNGTDGVEALGTSTAGDGGSIDLTVGGHLTVYDPVLADSGASGMTSGGRIRMKAGGHVWVGSSGNISAYGRQGGGGEIVIVSENDDVLLYRPVEAEGIGSGANGGSVEVSAGNKLEVGHPISVLGGVNVSGSAADGGSVELLAGCGGIDITAAIEAGGVSGTGASEVDSGGGIVIESRGMVEISSGVVLDTRALQSGGSGGSVRIAARDLVDLQGTAKIDTRGSTSSGGQAGSVQITGCRVKVASGATIDATGAIGGTIALRASKAPPTTNGSEPQPMTIGSASVIHAAGSTNADNGRIELSPLHSQPGVCSNNPARECAVDADCTAGCETGTCSYANPDTAGLSSQFDVVPSRQEEADFGECQATCD